MAEFDADAFADSLPGWDPEARSAFLASLDDDDAPELPLLAESVDEMDPAMVEGVDAAEGRRRAASELAVVRKSRRRQRAPICDCSINGSPYSPDNQRHTGNRMFYREAAKDREAAIALGRPRALRRRAQRSRR